MKKKMAPENPESMQDEPMLAKRKFVICHNEYFLLIDVGQDLSDVPEKYRENLRTEGVL